MNDVQTTTPEQGSDPQEDVFSEAVGTDVDAALVLDSGEVFWGYGAGASGEAVGEVCFNTSMTGYQEILTDPSYAGQLVTFTFPHIGNVGANPDDLEADIPASQGCILRESITEPASWRSAQHFDAWLKSCNLPAITGVDTRRLVHHIRDYGAPTGTLVYTPGRLPNVKFAHEKALAFRGIEGLDLAKEVTCQHSYSLDVIEWGQGTSIGHETNSKYHVVAVDFGVKRNILRSLVRLGCKVTVVPAFVTAKEILALNPDGVFLSNGPGDPAATGKYAVPMVKDILQSEIPLFGICLGHQILSLALGAKTHKMHIGHRGGNQPVKHLETGKVEITSQNHGFVVDRNTLPAGVTESHVSLFDGSNEGIRVEGKPVFSVQYHPEASPGPQDSLYLFKNFIDFIAG